MRSCPYVINLFKYILLSPHMCYKVETNKALQYNYASKKLSPILTPKKLLFINMTSFLTQTCPSCLESMNIEQIPLFSPTFRHSKSLHVSQSFSSSITREFQKETEKEIGSVTAEYTSADVQYFSYVIIYFVWWTQMAKRHTSHTLSHLHNPRFLSNKVTFYFFLAWIFTVWC